MPALWYTLGVLRTGFPSRFHMQRGFSLIELLISIAIIAVLLSILLPALSHARRISSKAVCASNLRQIGMAWDGYAADPQNRNQVPRAETSPEWNFGGVRFRGPARIASLDMTRPINSYLDEHPESTNDESGNAALVGVFKCPGDTGVFTRGQSAVGARTSVLPRGSAYQTFGNSYRANDALLDSTIAGLDDLSRPLKQQDIHVAASRLLVAADSAWYYATRPQDDVDSALEASWHGKLDSGNMLAADNSVRFENFKDNTSIAIIPRPAPDRR